MFLGWHNVLASSIYSKLNIQMTPWLSLQELWFHFSLSGFSISLEPGIRLHDPLSPKSSMHAKSVAHGQCCLALFHVWTGVWPPKTTVLLVSVCLPEILFWTPIFKHEIPSAVYNLGSFLSNELEFSQNGALGRWNPILKEFFLSS